MNAAAAKASPEPLGLTLTEDGANAAVVSRHAERIILCLFDESGGTEIERLPLTGRAGDTHFGFFPGLKAGQRYGLRAEGPFDPARGHRFDTSKLLLDPYARRIDRAFAYTPELGRLGFETASLVPKAIVGERGRHSSSRVRKPPGFIYEIAVRAFTKMHPEIPEPLRGTVAALAHPAVIEHLVKLGVDTVELMPLAAWIAERHLPSLGLRNAWGYNPVNFMAPDPRLAPGGFAEIRQAVAALHAAGIQVVLDAVFNHTGESDVMGATLSLRGLDNALYYRHDGEGRLVNDTGCGNTIAADDPAVVCLILDAMRCWIDETDIDGFRFDLATVLGRTRDGFSTDAPVLAAIDSDPVFKNLIMIAEPWDVGPGGYRLGAFPPRWREWNDRYRDDMRRFWRGDQGMAGALATRLAGSSDIFGKRQPSCSVNFIAAHDGFTLRDAVSYRAKHNDANGESNRDGTNSNFSWNNGVEGGTGDPAISAARARDARALLASLFVSRGTLMLTAGDEFGRTQKGNNNAYAQDNELTWLDWASADTSLIGFVSRLAETRRTHPALARDRFLTGEAQNASGLPDAAWLRLDGQVMAEADWNDESRQVVGLALYDAEGEGDRCCLWLNSGREAVRVSLPPARDGHRWTMILTSSDASESDHEIPARSVVIFAETVMHLAQRGASDEMVRELAALAGIQPVWWTVGGERHDVGIETQRALLKAMGLPGDTVPDVEHSRHRLAQQAPSEAATSQTCFLAPAIAKGGKVFGLAAHLYCLRGPQPAALGNFFALRDFCETAKREGAAFAGINPLHHLFPTDRERASPYQPSDRRFVDPIYIDIEAAAALTGSRKAKAVLKSNAAEIAALDRLRHIDYPAAWRIAKQALSAAFDDFTPAKKHWKALQAYCAQGGEALRLHAVFETIADHHGTVDRAQWPQGLRDANSLQAKEFAAAHESGVLFRQWLQWLADRQLGESVAGGSALYRDLALGTAFDGGEIWADPELFATGVSLGAPPDPFSLSGQIWHLAPFQPHVLHERGLDPLRQIVASNMRHAGMLRIDHVLGLQRQFWVPQGAEGRDGAYVSFPADALLAMIAEGSRRARCMVVGEDLGTVPEGLREKLAAGNFFSYKVLWFERDGPGFKPPESYPYLSLSCIGSHDLPTFAGFMAGAHLDLDERLRRSTNAEARRRDYERERELLKTTLQAADEHAMPIAAHEFLTRTGSAIAFAQVDDLFGETEQLNVPGTNREYPNWRRRDRHPIAELSRLSPARDMLERLRKIRGG